ncbi:MAG: hypothetical protein M3P84_13035, partial [Chloroflexota bacterium]|nr:hypothetical protein [Chloroflexota bacterium]
QTTLPFHRQVVRDPSFLAAELSTGWVDDHWDGPQDRERAVQTALLAAALAVGVGDPAAPHLAGPAMDAPDADRDGRRPESPWRLAGMGDALDRWPVE